jgi:hypothetical protein
MNLDSNVSDMMQLSEFLYEYAILLRYHLQTGLLISEDEIKSLNQYVTEYCIQHLLDDENFDFALTDTFF